MINLDYYGITFEKHSTLSISQFFQELRKDFGGLIFKESDAGEFNPYPFKDDKMASENKKKWESTQPKGALMNFVLESSHSFGISWDRSSGRLQINLEEGDVLVTCSSATDFIFSVVKTEAHGWHPVSGNRGFGVKDNGDGTWTFYTMAADRISRHFIASIVKETVFEQGHKVWLGMLANFQKKFADLSPRSPVINSRRYNYPACCGF